MYVALDIGNVLVDVDFSDFTQSLAQKFKLTTAQAHQLVLQCQAQVDLGQSTIAELFPGLQNQWLQIPQPNPKMMTVIDSLLARGYRIALLSNIGFEHASVMRQSFVDSRFIQHFSCEVGYRKPDYEFFQTFLDQYPEFIGCPYIDDLPDNVAMAAKMGFEAVQFELDNMTPELWYRLNSVL